MGFRRLASIKARWMLNLFGVKCSPLREPFARPVLFWSYTPSESKSRHLCSQSPGRQKILPTEEGVQACPGAPVNLTRVCVFTGYAVLSALFGDTDGKLLVRGREEK